MRTFTVSTNIIFYAGGGEEHEIPVEATIGASPATRDYYDKSLGGWLPGDPGEIELQALKIKHGEALVDAPDWLFDMMADDDGWLGEEANDALDRDADAAAEAKAEAIAEAREQDR